MVELQPWILRLCKGEPAVVRWLWASLPECYGCCIEPLTLSLSEPTLCDIRKLSIS